MKINIINMKPKKVFKFNIIYYFHLILFISVLFYLGYNLLYGLLSTIDLLNNSDWSDSVFNMSDVNTLQNSSTYTQTTPVKIILRRDDGNWSGAIRQLFIYGTGAFRLNLARSGGPGTKTFIIASTLLADAGSKIINNTINDPEYVVRHLESWKKIWDNKVSDVAHVIIDSSTQKAIENALPPSSVGARESLISQNFISPSDVAGFSEKMFNTLIGQLKGVLEPVYVDYSNDLLLNQIYGLSILLFVLSLLIIILFIAFILNVLVFAYSENLLIYFTNYYIRLYIKFNKKMIGIEIFFLSGSILYFLYVLSRGLHFICTHPVNLS
jgi:hypothetical protein